MLRLRPSDVAFVASSGAFVYGVRLLVVRPASGPPLEGLPWLLAAPWGLLALIVALAALRWSVAGRGGLRRIAAYLLLAFIYSAAATAASVVILAWRTGGADSVIDWSRSIDLWAGRGLLWLDVATYLAIVSAGQVLTISRRMRESELAAARLAADLATAQLRLLRSQLDPHFMFNALHAVSSLVHDDPTRAVATLSRLGELLRTSLKAGNRDLVSLAQEIGHAQTYLEVEHVRFGAGLHCTFDIEADCQDLAVPSLLLQPLLENAIRHGRVAGRRLSIEVVARRAGPSLRLAIDDDGRGFVGTSSECTPRDGIGLGNTRCRLATLYGAAGRLELLGRPTGGTRVLLHLPIATVNPEEDPR
jgi:signal transduction histidine kinase